LATQLKMGTLEVSSPAFEMHGQIPKKYASDGEDVSPPVRWSGAPAETREFALICHDPDAPMPGGFTHWVVYRIPREMSELPEGISGKHQVTEGANGSGKSGYAGPAPPAGHGLHHYYFWVFALDTNLDSLVQGNLTREQLIEEIKDDVLEQARTVGTYEK
jgi:Raf kinase inhibitor-like YbhB/YbcL family protein